MSTKCKKSSKRNQISFNYKPMSEAELVEGMLKRSNGAHTTNFSVSANQVKKMHHELQKAIEVHDNKVNDIHKVRKLFDEAFERNKNKITPDEVKLICEVHSKSEDQLSKKLKNGYNIVLAKLYDSDEKVIKHKAELDESLKKLNQQNDDYNFYANLLVKLSSADNRSKGVTV